MRLNDLEGVDRLKSPVKGRCRTTAGRLISPTNKAVGELCSGFPVIVQGKLDNALVLQLELPGEQKGLDH